MPLSLLLIFLLPSLVRCLSYVRNHLPQNLEGTMLLHSRHRCLYPGDGCYWDRWCPVDPQVIMAWSRRGTSWVELRGAACRCDSRSTKVCYSRCTYLRPRHATAIKVFRNERLGVGMRSDPRATVTKGVFDVGNSVSIPDGQSLRLAVRRCKGKKRLHVYISQQDVWSDGGWWHLETGRELVARLSGAE